MTETDAYIINNIGILLNDPTRPMKERFRALFTLRNIGGESSVRWIEKCFSDTSALLKHECAYCLGQMQDPLAVPKLESILSNTNEEPIVRHEAGEALAAIGLTSSLAVLRKFSVDPNPDVAETCQLAIEKILLSSNPNFEDCSKNPYNSIDPAPPLPETDSVEKLEALLLDETLPLFTRYRALFTLRNIGSTEAVVALAKGLKCKSALFRHEIAYVLGQIQNAACERQLVEVLCNKMENEMVRHECAEALGSIASENCGRILVDFILDDKRVVRESCEVALDMCEYENSTEFQYANALIKAKSITVK